MYLLATVLLFINNLVEKFVGPRSKFLKGAMFNKIQYYKTYVNKIAT